VVGDLAGEEETAEEDDGEAEGDANGGVPKAAAILPNFEMYISNLEI
jgi:hypothetical protein